MSDSTPGPLVATTVSGIESMVSLTAWEWGWQVLGDSQDFPSQGALRTDPHRCLSSSQKPEPPTLIEALSSPLGPPRCPAQTPPSPFLSNSSYLHSPRPLVDDSKQQSFEL